MARALESSDVVLGSRYVPGGSVYSAWPVWRKGLSAWGNFYARSILGLDLRDVTTGFRLWRREALQRMPLDDIQSSGYVFLVEMAYVASRMNMRFAQVPIDFSDRRWANRRCRCAFNSRQPCVSGRCAGRTEGSARPTRVTRPGREQAADGAAAAFAGLGRARSFLLGTRGLVAGFVLLGAVPRVWAALSDHSVFWPDEIYQSIEPRIARRSALD